MAAFICNLLNFTRFRMCKKMASDKLLKLGGFGRRRPV